MGSVKSVWTAPVRSVVQDQKQALAVSENLQEAQEKPAPKKPLTAAERRPDLYIRDQKVDAMSNSQIHGELRRMIRRNRLPHEIQLNEKTGGIKGVSKGALVDAALAVVLKIMLDNHERGMSPFPR